MKTSNGTLYFQTRNSKHHLQEKDQASGIGLQNVQRRLNLLYPERHLLKITETETEYMVDLKIQLQ